MTPGKLGASWCKDPELLAAVNRKNRALRTVQDARDILTAAQESLTHAEHELRDVKAKALRAAKVKA